MDLFNSFATNLDAEEKGIATQIPGAGDTEFVVARAGNKAYSKMLQRQVKLNRAVLDSKGDLATRKSDEILIDVVASTILLNWNGEITYKGKNYPYSKDAAKMLLAHKEFMSAVMKVAEDMETFKTVKDEEDLGK